MSSGGDADSITATANVWLTAGIAGLLYGAVELLRAKIQRVGIPRPLGHGGVKEHLVATSDSVCRAATAVEVRPPSEARVNLRSGLSTRESDLIVRLVEVSVISRDGVCVGGVLVNDGKPTSPSRPFQVLFA